MAGTASQVVAPVRALGRDDLERAGGKGANLGELIRIGMPVPDGFVVTTDAYAAVDVPARDRASYEHAELPAPLASAIADAYTMLSGGPWQCGPARRPKTCPAPRSPASRTPT